LKTRNSEVLADFVAYCKAHPQERFWQALRNWVGASFVLVSSFGPMGNHCNRKYQEDTFSWERRDG
jgi:hypothetical protein